MGRPKKYYLIVDTETCNTVQEPLPYDIGWVITDRHGNIYRERSFVVIETFLDMTDVMQTAYYKEKIPKYWDDIKAGTRSLRKMWDIRKIMMNDIKEYNVEIVGAYNMAFDLKALNNLIRWVSKSWRRWWFPFNTKYIDIWHMACQVLLNRSTYMKFARKNNLISSSGNFQTTAEVTYQYITKRIDFNEEHTGLEDVKIEVEIFAYCFRQHKKMNMGINKNCWRIPQYRKK